MQILSSANLMASTGTTAPSSGSGKPMAENTAGGFFASLLQQASTGASQDADHAAGGNPMNQLLMDPLLVANWFNSGTEDVDVQVDELISLLDEQSLEEATALIAQPSMQVLLLHIEQFLANQAKSSDEATTLQAEGLSKLLQQTEDADEHDLQIDEETMVDPFVFMPLLQAQGLVETADSDEGLQTVVNQNGSAYDLQAAHELLKRLEDWKNGGKTLQTEAMVSQAGKKETTEHNLVVNRNFAANLQQEAFSDQQAPKADIAVNRLEMLAAKTAMPILASKELSNEAELFQPLDVDADGVERSVITMHDTKTVSGNEQLNKVQTLHVPAHRFSEEVSKFIVQSFTLGTTADGVKEAKISLYPQHLGQLDVKLSMQNGQLVAQFMAESATGKEMLESQLSQLRATLQQQGIQVEKLEVTQSSSLSSGMFHEQRQPSQQSSKQQKLSERHEEVDEVAAPSTASVSSGQQKASGAGTIDITA